MSNKPDPDLSGTYDRTDPMLASDRGFVALFLRPDKRFLFKAIWPMYEYSEVAGTWKATGSVITLSGIRSGWTDVISDDGHNYRPRPFRMSLERDSAGGSLRITRADNSTGIFGVNGPYVFLGTDALRGRSGEMLAESLSVVDDEIAACLAEAEDARG